MRKIGRKVKQKAQGLRIEQTTESKLIRERMRKVDDVERFMSIVVASLQRTLTLSKNETESEIQFYELLKSEGEEWKKDDFELGALLSKLSQVGMLIQNAKTKYNEQINSKLCEPMLNFIRFDVKEARLTKRKYDKLHYIYQVSIEKVKQINQSSKVVLSKLQEAEAERDSLKELFDKTGKATSMNLYQTYEKSKSNIVTQMCEYLESLMEYHSNAYKTLSKVVADIKKYREHAQKKREELRKIEENDQTEKVHWVKGAANKNKSLNPRMVAASSVRMSGTDGVGYELPSSMRFDIVRVSRRPEKFSMSLNFDRRSIGIRREKTQEFWDVPIDNLLQVIKSHKQSKCMKFRWRGRETKFDSYTFQSAVERERFYEAFWFIKNGFTREVLLSRKPPTTREIKIFCGSWNIGDAPPPYNVPLDCWIPKDQFDIVAVAFQECDYTPRDGYISCEDDCFAWIGQHLGENYMKLAGASLWAIRIVVFVKRDLYYKITRLKTSTVATGLAKVIGNKGGAGVAFNLYDTRLCFVGAHLAARIDRRRMELRHQHYRDIMRDLNFSENGDNHHEFDHLFWMGDLNYRVELPRNEIIKLCEQKNWPALLKHDQLTNERLAENVFLDFEEGPINFLPTYRFNRGEQTWSEEKMREPAWCDRVLWKSIPKGRVRQLEYSGCYDIMTSDHRPIYATFVVTIDLPNIPHQREPCKIIISHLRGHDLKASKGYTEPYVIFQASWLEESVSTLPASDKSTNPSWNDRDIPALIPVVTNKEFLQKKWIRVVVREKSDNSSMGQGVIYLENAFGNEPAPFSTRLVDKGRVYGRLEGRIHVHYSQGTTKIPLSTPLTVIRPAQPVSSPLSTTPSELLEKQSQTITNTTLSPKPGSQRVMSGEFTSSPLSSKPGLWVSPKEAHSDQTPSSRPAFARAFPSKSVAVGKDTSAPVSSSPPVSASSASNSSATVVNPTRVMNVPKEDHSFGTTTSTSFPLSQPTVPKVDQTLHFASTANASNSSETPSSNEAVTEHTTQQNLIDLKALATEVLSYSSIDEFNEELESDSDTTDSANNKEVDGDGTNPFDYDSEDEEDIEKRIRRGSDQPFSALVTLLQAFESENANEPRNENNTSNSSASRTEPTQSSSVSVSSLPTTSSKSITPSQSNEPSTSQSTVSSSASTVPPNTNQGNPIQPTAAKSPLSSPQTVVVKTQTNPDGSTTTITTTSTTKTVTTTTMSGSNNSNLSSNITNSPNPTVKATTTTVYPQVRKVESMPSLSSSQSSLSAFSSTSLSVPAPTFTPTSTLASTLASTSSSSSSSSSTFTPTSTFVSTSTSSSSSSSSSTPARTWKSTVPSIKMVNRTTSPSPTTTSNPSISSQSNTNKQ